MKLIIKDGVCKNRVEKIFGEIVNNQEKNPTGLNKYFWLSTLAKLINLNYMTSLYFPVYSPLWI